VGVRKLESFNHLIEKYEAGKLDTDQLPHDSEGLNFFDKNYPAKLPYIVIIIDELADLMMVAKNEVETSITRILQKARAVGIHMVIATQRPSVDVVTGLLKANLPSRIAFAVSSGTDSRTILDAVGAERLLGQGDMLYWPIGKPYPQRVQGCFVSDGEIKKVVDYLKEIDDSEYDPSLGEYIRKSKEETSVEFDEDDTDNNWDSKLKQALEVILDANYASTSLIQRKLKVGYSRAGRLMDQLERLGIVGPQRGSKPREILVTPEEARDYVESLTKG
jgi:S-DNA-T family DNA segregation ATPase FtsK/SpoIIIE